MPRRCYGEHKLFAPIRPIALTLCDLVSLVAQNKLLAAILAGIVVCLLLSAHVAASYFDAHTFDLIYSIIKAYLSRTATSVIYQGVLHWALANGVFFAFRFGAYLILYAAYELGRGVVFALVLLAAIAVFVALVLGMLLDASGALNGQLAGSALLLAAIIGWFWFRYMSPRSDSHRSFDFDVGAALVRLRSH
jgi:hypothetical protein